MAGVLTRESYFETGLDVLSDRLLLALLLQLVDFSSWSMYTRALVDHWLQARTVSILDVIRAEPDPRRRIGGLIQEALALPHGAGAALRVWSSIDAEARAVQEAADRQRFDFIVEQLLHALDSGRFGTLPDIG